jgi:hypothetical protein
MKTIADSGHVGVQGIVELAGVFLGEDFLAIHGHVGGGLDANPHRVAVDLHDRDPDLVAHLEPLTELPAQDQHGLLLLENRLATGPTRLLREKSLERSDLSFLVTGNDRISDARYANGKLCKTGTQPKRPGPERFSADGAAPDFRDAAVIV